MAVSRDDKVDFRVWERAKEIFDAAVDLSSQEREYFLQEACADDSALQAEVKDLLDFHDRASSFLQDSTKSRMAGVSAAPVFSAGQVVANRFRIMRLIGSGGMGEVYVAYDLELGELVALKTLRSMLSADARMLTSFRQEVHLARQVTHPNVCRIFDMFWHQNSDQNAIAILTMEYLPGQTLLDLIRSSGPLSPAEALPIIRQIAEGLDAAHQFDIIHGDFKSGNVMLVPQSNGTIRAVITDFGLAREQHQPAQQDSEGVIGTPAYIAPEQLQNAPLTPAVDIYAFGVVLFEMLTGEPPFRGGPGTLIALKQQQTEPPSLELNVDLDAGWQSTILKCIDPVPDHRPASASEVVRLFSAKPRWSLSRRLIATAVLIAFLFGLYFYFRPYAVNPLAQALVDRARVALENHSADGFNQAIADYKGAIKLAPNWALAHAELAYTYAAASNARFMNGKQALPLARDAALEAIQLDPKMGKAYGALAWTQSLDFDGWAQAEQSFRRALDLSPDDGKIHFWFGVYLRKTGKFSEAEEEDILARNLTHQREPEIWCELAFLYWTANKITKFHEHMMEQVSIYPKDELTLYLYARLLKIEGEFGKAESELSLSQMLGMNPVTIMAERASLAIYRGDLPAARNYAEELTRLSKQQEIDGLLLAGIYAQLHDFDTAFAVLEEAYRRKDSTLLSIATSPVLEPLRGDPRYKSLLQKLHFDDQIMQQMEFNSFSPSGLESQPN